MTTPSLAQAALRRLAPARMVNGVYVDEETGRPAYYGPNGEPGTATRTAQYSAEYVMPDGRTAYFQPGNLNYGDPARNARTAPQTMPNLSPQLAQNGGTALPFDADLSDVRAQLALERSRFESDATAEQQRIQREAMMATREAQQNLPDQQRGLLENYAGRGLAFSSGYAHDQTNQQAEFAEYLSKINQGQTEGLADLMRQRGQFNDEWAGRLQGAQAAAARRLAESAGQLGLNDPMQGGQPQQQGTTPNGTARDAVNSGPWRSPVQNSPAGQGAIAPQQPKAVMRNGVYTDVASGRPAYYGPEGQGGYAKPQAPAGAKAYKMPDGRIAYYL